MINDKECMHKRAVKSCEECCRYYDCKNNTKTLFSNDKGCIELGYDIVASNAQLFKKAWRRGYICTIDFLTTYFKGQTPSIITGEKCDGMYVLESLRRVCLEEYGTLEHCHAKLEQRVKAKIKELEELRSKETSRKRKFEITNQINEVKGELNF